MINSELKQKRLSFLNGEIEFFSNNFLGVEREAPNKMGECKYYFLDANGKRAGCAIGRHMTEENAKKAQKIGGQINSYSIFELCPDNLKELGWDFLFQIQLLHDGQSLYWADEENDVKTLSEKGLEFVGKIKKKFIDNLSD